MNSNWQAFLSSQGAVIENNTVQGFGSVEGLYSSEETYLCELSAYGIIQASGEDAQSFLHGQFTNDLNHVTETISQISGYCNPKGRLLSVFRIFMRDNKYFLVMPKDVIEPVLKKLTMFKLMAKVELTDVTNDFPIFGMAGSKTESILSENNIQFPDKIHHCIHIEETTAINIPGTTTRVLFISTPEKSQSMWNAFAQNSKIDSSNIWQLFDVHAGIPQITGETFESFTPQMVNLELIDGVNFQKGCYPGQEVVARTHYLGKPNRRMYCINIICESTPTVGENIYSLTDGDQAVGKIVTTQFLSEKTYLALAVLRTVKENANDLRIESSNNSEINFVPLPYSLEQENN